MNQLETSINVNERLRNKPSLTFKMPIIYLLIYLTDYLKIVKYYILLLNV